MFCFSDYYHFGRNIHDNVNKKLVYMLEDEGLYGEDEENNKQKNKKVLNK